VLVGIVIGSSISRSLQCLKKATEGHGAPDMRAGRCLVRALARELPTFSIALVILEKC
jgi:hypothetical protein